MRILRRMKTLVENFKELEKTRTRKELESSLIELKIKFK